MFLAGLFSLSGSFQTEVVYCIETDQRTNRNIHNHVFCHMEAHVIDLTSFLLTVSLGDQDMAVEAMRSDVLISCDVLVLVVSFVVSTFLFT